ncbi:MAG TPA: hypothetical protein VK178_05595 [Opitutaceae bacterium]|nr:hypothetical protein [Opitutaceae bacterium]
MRGTLDDATAGRIVDAFLARRSPAPQQTHNDDVARLAAATRITPARFEKVAAALTETAKADAAELDQTAAAQADWIRARLDSAKVTLGRPHADHRARLMQALTDHVWVQVKTGDDSEQWLDLDPSLPGANPGMIAATDAAPVDDDQVESHALRFRLVYVRTISGGTDERDLIDLTIPAERGLTEHGLFFIEPTEAPPPPSQLLQLTPDQHAAFWRGVKTYRAGLRFGDETALSSPFDLAGNITTPASGSPGDLTGGMGGVFGFDGGEEEPEAKDTAFVELVAIFTLTGPGAHAQPQRRVLFSAADLGGKGVATPALIWQILLQPGRYPAEVAAHAGLQNQIRTLEPLLALLAAPTIGAADLDRYVADTDDTFASLPVQLAVLREEAVARRLLAHPNVTAFFPAPQLAFIEQRVCADGGAHGCGRSRFDIVENGVAFVPRDDSGGEAAAAAALEQGVFDTLAEARLLMRATAGPTINTPIDVFELSRQTKKTLAITEATAEAIPLRPEDCAWIAVCEPTNRLVLTVPGDRTAWWSLDPSTGTILGRAHGGGGQAATEKKVLDNKTAMTVLRKALECTGNAAVAAGNNFQTDGKLTEKTSVGFAVSLLGCITTAHVGFFKPVYGDTLTFAFVSWALPHAVNAIGKGLKK